MPHPSPVPARLLRDPGHFLALGFGSGLARVAPGTWGTVAAIPIYLLVTALPSAAYVPLVLFLAAVGPWLCGRTAAALGVHDHPGIVWDEIVGYLVTMWLAPDGWLWVVAGFLLFRLFDVWKPWPIRWLDRRMAGGLGIMVDDLLAGAFAWAALQVLALYAGGGIS